MERREVRARVYNLLAKPLYPPGAELWQAIGSGTWAAETAEALGALGLGFEVPAGLGAGSPEQAERDYSRAFLEPGHPLKPIESIYKPWTSDPGAELPMAREKGWLGGDSAAHLQAVYDSLGIEIPADLAHAPDHLALELEFMALLVEQGTPESQALFRAQHLDWVGELAADAQRPEVPPLYRALLSLIARFVVLDEA